MAGWDIDKYKVSIQLLDPMLGTTPTQKSIWAQHIGSKQGKALKKEGMSPADIEAELEATIAGIADNDEQAQGHTSFMQDEAGYYIRDYMLRGYLKEAANNLKQFGALKQLKSKVSKYLFVKPVKIYVAPPGAKLEVVERPLRCETPQGSRTAIARSDSVPAGTVLNFELHSLQDVLKESCIRTFLEYGSYQGLAQWRSSGAGRFEVLEFEALS